MGNIVITNNGRPAEVSVTDEETGVVTVLPKDPDVVITVHGGAPYQKILKPGESHGLPYGQTYEIGVGE